MNFYLKPGSHYSAVIFSLMNLSPFQSNLHLNLSSSITLSTAHLSSIPNPGFHLTFPPPRASPPAPVRDPPAELPNPLCWTSGSPLDEPLCLSGLCSRKVRKRKVVRCLTGQMSVYTMNIYNWKLMWEWIELLEKQNDNEKTL